MYRRQDFVFKTQTIKLFGIKVLICTLLR